MGWPLVKTPTISNPKAFIRREIRANATQAMPTQYVSRAIIFTSIAALPELAVAKYIGRDRESTLAACRGTGSASDSRLIRSCDRCSQQDPYFSGERSAKAGLQSFATHGGESGRDRSRRNKTGNGFGT